MSRQVLGPQPRQQFPGRLAALGIKTQVQRAVGIETEPALAVRQLVAGQAQVEQDSLHVADTGRVKYLGQLTEIRLGDFDRQPRQFHFRAGNRLGIPVDGHHAAVGSNSFGQQPRVTAAAQRAVRKHLARLRIQRGQHLRGEHGNVDGSPNRHDGATRDQPVGPTDDTPHHTRRRRTLGIVAAQACDPGRIPAPYRGPSQQQTVTSRHTARYSSPPGTSRSRTREKLYGRRIDRWSVSLWPLTEQPLFA